ncbi:MAG: mannitol dehydrogenase family protein [Propionibacteriaceae bacterium]|nr:mannitol dehydrogenase family protein [Propionibacteriaceae bacterium]
MSPAAPAVELPRLDAAHLDRLPADARPLVRTADLRPRLVHFGPGAFNRAHQCVYTEAANAATGQDWGQVAVAPSAQATVEAIRRQCGYFSIRQLRPDAVATRVVGAIVQAHLSGADPAQVQAVLTSPETTVVTLTITEKGYALDEASGRLDLTRPSVAQDLTAVAAGDWPTSPIGHLAQAVATRARTHQAALNLISCDNRAANGTALARAVDDFLAASAWTDRDRLRSWLADRVAFPSTLVDRIVPAPTDHERAQAGAALGLRDDLAVAAEPFRQWVIEDRFSADRPPWEAAGAVLVADVAPYQLTKLRLLNGVHSALAYLGLAAGLSSIDQVLRTAWGPGLVRSWAGEAGASLPPGGPDPAAYADSLVERLSNPALSHKLRQIGSDGSQKVPYRWFEGARRLRQQGQSTPLHQLALAAWGLSCQPGPDGGQRWGTSDPRADQLAACWSQPTELALAGLLDAVGFPDLAQDDGFVPGAADRLPALRAGRIEL